MILVMILGGDGYYITLTIFVLSSASDTPTLTG